MPWHIRQKYFTALILIHLFIFSAKEKFGIPSDTSMYLMDETGTEVDKDVFTDVIEEKSDILWTIIDVHLVTDTKLYTLFFLAGIYTKQFIS